MSGIPNTVRKAGVYHFRRGVPKSLREFIGRAELLRSLLTNDFVLARRRSRRLYLETEALFVLVRSTPMLDDRQISELVQRFYRFELDDENRMRLEGVTFDEAGRRAAIAYYERFGQSVREALGRNELAAADVWIDELLAREGMGPDLNPHSRAKLAQGLLRASGDISRALQKRFEGNFNHVPGDGLLVVRPDPVSPPAPSLSVREAPAKTGSPLFAERAEEFRQTRERRSVWDRQTALQARNTYRLFADVSGNRPTGEYRRADAVHFKDLLLDLPASYGKARSYRGMSAEAVMEASRRTGEPRLSTRTVQRHLSALSVLWDEEVEAGRATENIFRNFRLPSAKRPKDQRAMWPSSKLGLLFDSPVWNGCHSRARRSTPGPYVFRDERFWLPLIALFSGMRQEEICQLELSDLREEEGIWVFDVHGRGDHNVKNLTAVRLVPVHSELKRIGLLEYAGSIRGEGHTRLFPQMKKGGADARYGHNFSKWFTRYRKDRDLFEPGLDFHSFRHSATTFMMRSGIASEVIDRVTGHVTAGETARYTKEFRLEQLRDAIEGINPNIDLGFLHVRKAP